MEEIKKNPPAPERVITYGSVLLAIITVVVICVFTFNPISANAAQSAAVPAVNQPDYAALYQDALDRIAELEQTCADQDLVISEGKALAAEQAELLAEQDADIAELIAEVTKARQEKEALIAKYGTVYYADLEIRHSNLFCPEAILRFQFIVPAETYDTLYKGQVLPVSSVFHSIPSGSDINKWTATVVDLEEDPVWEQIP